MRMQAIGEAEAARACSAMPKPMMKANPSPLQLRVFHKGLTATEQTSPTTEIVQEFSEDAHEADEAVLTRPVPSKILLPRHEKPADRKLSTQGSTWREFAKQRNCSSCPVVHGGVPPVRMED